MRVKRWTAWVWRWGRFWCGRRRQSCGWMGFRREGRIVFLALEQRWDYPEAAQLLGRSRIPLLGSPVVGLDLDWGRDQVLS